MMSMSDYTGLNPFNFIHEHGSTGLYHSPSAQQLYERCVDAAGQGR